MLGVSEAGLFPGVIYVFSVYYRRHERSWRVAVFFGGAALAGAFGGELLPTTPFSLSQCSKTRSTGILAYVIGKMEGIGGRRGWQWYHAARLILFLCIDRRNLKDFHHRRNLNSRHRHFFIHGRANLVSQGYICMFL